MARKNVDGVIRKRSLIEKTRKNVLLWVGGAATLVGVVLVISWMIVQTGMFNQKIIGMKQDTLDQIEQNIDQAQELKADINLLNTDENLLSARTSQDAPALQTILDSLPADENRLALGASLQQKVFQAQGVSLDALSIDTTGVSTGGAVDESSGGDDLIPLEFSATISGSPTDIRNVLIDVERSIRAINLKTVVGATAGNNVSLRVTGNVYYYPPADLGLGNRVVTE